MLVLTRGCGEKILVPRYGISFKVLEIHGRDVRIGISGPTDVGVVREEVWERLRREAHAPDELVATEPPPAKG